ncbi:hypothetical protein DIPPA_70033 [Diplonema papillatum]|nr:hypothetical protein DIPPA_70033 [Diplonema papillatum]
MKWVLRTQLRSCSGGPARRPVEVVPQCDADVASAESRTKYLKEKWKPDPANLPGVVLAAHENDNDAEYIERQFGVFDEPQTVRPSTDALEDNMITDRRSDIAYPGYKPMMEPMKNDRLYAEVESPSNIDGTSPKSWVLQEIFDQPSFEEALGEQLFRSTDLDRNSTELYPVGYGLAVNTCALLIEEEGTARRFYHICGGRSDHKTFVEGHCVTLRVDAALFFHVLHYFGENWGIAKTRQKYFHKYRGLCVWGRGLDDEDVAFLDGFFDVANLSMSVDIDRMDEGCEGYVPVKFHHQGTSTEKAPNADNWNGSSQGYFLWQNFFMSVPNNTDTDAEWVKKFWRDPFLLRPIKNINARAFNHAADPLPGQDPEEFELRWGANGMRGTELKEQLNAQRAMSAGHQVTAVMQPHHRASRKITEPFHHGLRHPMFTTKPVM